MLKRDNLWYHPKKRNKRPRARLNEHAQAPFPPSPSKSVSDKILLNASGRARIEKRLYCFCKIQLRMAMPHIL